MSQNSNSNRGIGITGILTIVFIVLKLTKQINWSWLWVLSPIWITVIMAFLIVLIVTIIEIIVKR